MEPHSSTTRDPGVRGMTVKSSEHAELTQTHGRADDRMSAALAFAAAPKAQLRERTRRSAELHTPARRDLPQIAVGTLDVSHPIYVESAAGARVLDVDGNEYIDLTMGFGVHILGHAPSVALDALGQAAQQGLQHAMHSAYQQPLATFIRQAYPTNEQVLFCNSGTEATLHAIRLARTFTGKPLIAVFDGGYHGAHDYCMVSVDPTSPRSSPRLISRGGGIPEAVLSTTVMLPYWDEAAFETIRELKDELAVVLIEPVQGSNPQTEQGPWLRKLREVCTEHGILLLFDEVITGFRLGFGGGQATFDIGADLSTYGKILGGGLPVGAVAGRRELMELFAAQPGGPPVFAVGTFSGNPASMAAGAAVLSHLDRHPEIYERLHLQSNRLATELNSFFVNEELPARVLVADSILFLKLVSPEAVVRSVRDSVLEPVWAAVYDGLQVRLLERGVMLPGSHQFHLSAAHTDDDVSHVIESCKEVFGEAREAGLL